MVGLFASLVYDDHDKGNELYDDDDGEDDDDDDGPCLPGEGE